MSDPLIGKQLGDYVIQGLLGRGGMARVYKGYDDRLQRYAAVKVINSDFNAADQAEYTERFRREARAIARLHHPNIVGVYQFGEYEGHYYMAMVFIEGKDLRQILKENAERGQATPLSEILNFVRGIGSALDYAHSRGVIHRDIKPSNIMLDTDNRAILTDFGLALSMSEGTLGDTFGSAHYIAPEQAVSSAKAVPQSDLYSLGVCLYEMLAGKVPFDDPSAMSVALKHLNEAPPPPTLFNPDLLPSIERVVLKILDKDPNQRYATGAALTEALERAMHSDTTEQTVVLPVKKAEDPTPAPIEIDARKIAAQVHESRLQEIKSAEKRKTSELEKVKAPIDPARATPIRGLTADEDVIPTTIGTTVAAQVTTSQAAPGQTNPPASTEAASVKGGGGSKLFLILIPIVLVAIIVVGLLASGVLKGAGPTPTAVAAATEGSTATSPAVVAATNAATATNTSKTEPSAASTEITPSATTPAAVTATTVPATEAILPPTDPSTAAATLSGTSEVVPASEGNTVKLVWDDYQLTLLNTSKQAINISKLTFIQRGSSEATTRSFDTLLWDVQDSNVRPISMAPRICYQVYRNDKVLPTPTPPCIADPINGINTRAAWAKVSEPRRFWIAADDNVKTFDVVQEDKTIATCTISDGTCEFVVP